ncbi:MAG: hypothetical protein ABR898_12470 [Terracidiphilus sp.]|jgi:hypothetical protein
MARFGYFQLNNYGDPVVKQEVDADYVINPGGGETVQLFKTSKNSSEEDSIVAVFRLRGGEFVRQL